MLNNIISSLLELEYLKLLNDPLVQGFSFVKSATNLGGKVTVYFRKKILEEYSVSSELESKYMTETNSDSECWLAVQ